MGISFLACPPVTELTPSVKQPQDRSVLGVKQAGRQHLCTWNQGNTALLLS